MRQKEEVWIEGKRVRVGRWDQIWVPRLNVSDLQLDFVEKNLWLEQKEELEVSVEIY